MAAQPWGFDLGWYCGLWCFTGLALGDFLLVCCCTTGSASVEVYAPALVGRRRVPLAPGELGALADCLTTDGSVPLLWWVEVLWLGLGSIW